MSNKTFGCAGPDDCVLFLHQHAAGDFLPPPDAR